VFNTLSIIPSEFWYIWCTLAQFTFARLSVIFCLYTKLPFGTLGSFMVIFGTFSTVGTFGTPVVFGTLRIGSVFGAPKPTYNVLVRGGGQWLGVKM